MTNVTAVIRDPSGNTYANALVIASFVGQSPTPGAGPYLAGGLPTGQFELINPSETDSAGNLAMPLVGNDIILPSPSQWKFSVVSNTAPAVSFSTLITITGAAQDISAALQAAAAPLFPSVSFTNVGTINFAEQASVPPGAAGFDNVWANGVKPNSHRLMANLNNTGPFPVALFSDPLSVFAPTTSTQLAGVISDKLGSGPLGFSVGAALSPLSLNSQIFMADQFANVQAAITACVAAGGGVVDARSPNTNRTMGALDTTSNTIPVTLLLGPFIYTFTQITARQGFNILGAGLINTTLSNVGTNANPAFVIPQVNNNAIIFHWSDFQVLGLAGNTSQDGIFFDASTLTNAGVELSTFTNLQFTGFKGAGIHLKATQDGVSGSIGAIQGLSFFNVTSIRPTGATGAAQNALRIEGGCGQIGFWDCWFTGATNDTGTNVFTGTTGTQAPYSIHHHITTNQNGFAYLFDGAIGCTTEKDHFENIKGCYNFANTASPIVGFRSESAYINSNVAVNAGNGYIVNVPVGTPSVDVLIESPMIGGQPDKTIVNATNGTNVRMLNAQYLPGNTPVNVSVSSGVTYQGTPAATLDVRCARTVILSASATSITTLKSGLQPGEFIAFYATGGSAQFATGGNISLGTQTSPMVIPSGDSATFMRVDAGAAAFVLVGLSTKTLTGPVINGTPTGTGISTVTFKKGTGAGNYSSASTSDVAVDGTNLAATITIPTGWKLTIMASGGITSLTAIVTVFVGIADGGTVVLTQPVNASGIGNFAPFALIWEINGDGAAHTIDLRYHTSNGADSVSINNASATQLPTMVFTLMPSN